MKAKLTSQPQPKRVVLGKHLPLKTPFVIYIEPSGYCNLKCVFCPQTDKAFKQSQRVAMTRTLWGKVIRDLNGFFDAIKLLRVCGNGEPLTNPGIVNMLRYAQMSPQIERIELITNGTLLDSYLIKSLPRTVDRIIISIEGLNDRDYLKVSGRRVGFEQLVKKVKRLHANSGPCVIHVKIHHKAVPNKRRKAQFFKTFGDICDEIYIEKLIPMWPEFKSQHAVEEFRYGGKFTPKKVCVQMFKGFQIQANGICVPCCVDWRWRNVIGDVTQESVREVWEGAKLRALRRLHLAGKKSEIVPCNVCTMNNYNEVDNIDRDAKMILKQL